MVYGFCVDPNLLKPPLRVLSTKWAPSAAFARPFLENAVRCGVMGYIHTTFNMEFLIDI